MGKQTDLIFKINDQSYETKVKDVFFGDFTAADGDLAPAQQDLSKYQHVKDIEFININSKVEALIGNDHIQTWQGWGQTRYGTKGQPLAMETAWGWTITGPARKKNDSRASIALLLDEEKLLKDRHKEG